MQYFLLIILGEFEYEVKKKEPEGVKKNEEGENPKKGK